MAFRLASSSKSASRSIVAEGVPTADAVGLEVAWIGSFDAIASGIGYFARLGTASMASRTTPVTSGAAIAANRTLWEPDRADAHAIDATR